MQVAFYPKLSEEIVINQLMDPGKRHGKIKVDMIKMYVGEGEHAGMMVDMVPSQENQRAGKRAAGRQAGAAGTQASQVNEAQSKML